MPEKEHIRDMANLRESKLVGGLVDWLTGGLSRRLDFVEHDLQSLQKKTTRISKNQEGMAKAGDFIWRPKGNRHEAYSPDGCIILGFFLKPNKFL